MFPSQAQAALFQDFLLRANKYNKLQMLGESSGNDKKLILIEVSENFYDNLDVLTSCCWWIGVATNLTTFLQMSYYLLSLDSSLESNSTPT